MKSINPKDGTVLRVYEEHSWTDVEERLARAQDAWGTWRRVGFGDRGDVLVRVAAILRERKQKLAELCADEMGKPVTQGRAEIEKCALTCEHFAAHGARYLLPEVIATEASVSHVRFSPLGVVLAIMPWNFPFWQVIRFAAPALMAGNGVVLKHAANVCGCALALERVMADAGLAPGLFSSLLITRDKVARLIDHPAISAVTLTGSPVAGRAVASAAGAALKKVVLELGGSDPYVILDDADIPAAAAICARSRLQNTGQSCIAAKRLIVAASRMDELLAALTENMRAAVTGDPRAETTELGPLARIDLRDALHAQVVESRAQGAKVVLGGQVPPGPGAWYPPTVLTEVAPGMPAWDQELFGPVAAVCAANSEADAIAKANDSPFGLGAAVFSRDIDRGLRIADHELLAGSCFVNDFVRSDPRLPFGGIKQSGFGRELSVFGIRELVNIKTVCAA